LTILSLVSPAMPPPNLATRIPGGRGAGGEVGCAREPSVPHSSSRRRIASTNDGGPRFEIRLARHGIYIVPYGRPQYIKILTEAALEHIASEWEILMWRRIGILALLFLVPTFAAGDWLQFRGPGGLGVAADKNLPITWSDSTNLLWKTALPGPGSSSPIVVGNKILVTCYSGYGLDANDPGDITKLKRHLVCLDQQGKILWTRDVVTDAADAPFVGSFITKHGYASSTPVSDGKAIYCFFGVAGVVAFDLDGKQLWRTSVGA